MIVKNKEVSWHTLQLMCRLADTLRPKENMTLSEWADRYYIFPQGSSEAGKYSIDTVPYQKEIMDAITDPEVREVSVMSSAQVGKTTIILCGIGYYIDYEPSTQMLVLPTKEDAEKFSKTKLADAISNIPQLEARVADPKSRNSDNTILLKKFPGGVLSLGGANSPRSLAGDTRRIIWMDEVDRFPDSAGTEGNPIRLAEKRATSYWNKKFIKTSTPGNAKNSNILEAYEDGSMEEWNVQCPECGAWQPYSFQRLQFDTVSMACKECGVLVSEQRWKESKHKWIAIHPERKKIRSCRLNEMASPFVEWADMIRDFNKAEEKRKKFHDVEDLKTFINTELGEVWDETKYVEDAVDEKTLAKKAEIYDADIPDGVLLLTAAVDVQDDRFEIEIRGWARDYESWGIYKTEIYGKLILDEPWDQLEAYLEQPLYFSDGTELNIAGFAIDTGGHHTNQAYKWSKRMREKGKKCYAVKGYSNEKKLPLIYKRTIVDITEERNGKKFVVDRTLIYILGVDSGKDDITNRLKIEEPGAGYCHFPKNDGRGYDEEYYEGLTCEKKITKKVRGVIKEVWVKPSGARNEPFDLFNYNYAVEELLRPEWDKLEEKIKRGINYMKKGRKKPTQRGSYNAMED
jgi:phage terminase large subunit GpA-like protein